MHGRYHHGPLILHHRQTSIPSFGILDRLGLHPSPTLIKHGDHGTRAAGCAIQGSDKYLSSSDMYRHLNLLQELVSVRHNLLYYPALNASPGGDENSFGNRNHLVPCIGHVTRRQAPGIWDQGWNAPRTSTPLKRSTYSGALRYGWLQRLCSRQCQER